MTLHQIIALRFSLDEGFLGLVERAIKENLEPTSINQSIQNWKPNYNLDDGLVETIKMEIK